MSYLLGAKALKRLVQDQNAYEFVNARLTPDLFKADEKAMFDFVKNHHEQFHALPQMTTFESQFPDLKALEASEPPKYYLTLLDRRFGYTLLDKANQESQAHLKAHKDDVDGAANILQTALSRITMGKYRHRVLDFGKDAPALLMAAYHNMLGGDHPPAMFGWPYMDQQMGGMLGGDLVSIVGRPATGKTYHSLHVVRTNVFGPPKTNSLFVSMEMNTLAISQRLGAMYAGTNVGQLKVGGYSSLVFKQFLGSMQALQKEEAKLYVVDGNLAASVEDIYALASVLNCKLVWIDGAYLLKHKNPRLDRFTRVAENVEMMKKYTGELGIPTGASWQFNRKASEKHGKKGEEAGLEDIGYTDAIGQISSIVLGLLQTEGVETMQKRSVKVLKGRNGEIGEFHVNWNFDTMDFHQWGTEPEDAANDLAPGKPLAFL